MNRILKIAVLALVMMLGSTLRNEALAQPYAEGEVSYQTFYDELSPHGQWIDYPDQGYVWVPNAGSDFRPYSTNGHWVWTDDYEWMWVSDYEWGWAPFHYGRWNQDTRYGWYWVPGYEWSPAWVAWRDGGDYYGWAPLRPGINISVNFSMGSYNPPYDFWCFTPRRYITSRNIRNHYMDRRQNVTIINQTTIINNYNYNRNVFRTGPRRQDVEVYAGRITPARFRQSNAPGRTSFRNNEVNVYRPNVRRDDNRQFAPRNFERLDRNTAANTGRNANRTEANRGNVRNNNEAIDRRRREVSDRTNQVRNRSNETPERNNTVRPRVNNNNNEAIERRRREVSNRTPNAEVRPPVRQAQTPRNTNRNNEAIERRRAEVQNRSAETRQPRTRTVEQPQRQSAPRNNTQERVSRPQQQRVSSPPASRRIEQPRSTERRETRPSSNNNSGNGNRRIRN
jgi:hypothetical protein